MSYPLRWFSSYTIKIVNMAIFLSTDHKPLYIKHFLCIACLGGVYFEDNAAGCDWSQGCNTSQWEAAHAEGNEVTLESVYKQHRYHLWSLVVFSHYCKKFYHVFWYWGLYILRCLTRTAQQCSCLLQVLPEISVCLEWFQFICLFALLFSMQYHIANDRQWRLDSYQD